MPDVNIRDLTTEYSSGGYAVRPFDGYNLELKTGELVVLLGASGCGKTTLLSMLSTLLTPTSGSITVGDIEVTALRGAALTEYRRHTVGIVFQSSNLVPSLTARENPYVALRNAKVGRATPRERAEHLLTLVGLEERMGHKPGMLSRKAGTSVSSPPCSGCGGRRRPVQATPPPWSPATTFATSVRGGARPNSATSHPSLRSTPERPRVTPSRRARPLDLPTGRRGARRSPSHIAYHMVMARREVLVQLDDDLVRRLDALAEAQRTSRSELLRRGAAAVLEASDIADADRTLREAYRRIPQDPVVATAAARLAASTAPEW